MDYNSIHAKNKPEWAISSLLALWIGQRRGIIQWYLVLMCLSLEAISSWIGSRKTYKGIIILSKLTGETP